LTSFGKVGDPISGLVRRPCRTLLGVRKGVEEEFGGSILICGVVSEDIAGGLFSVCPGIMSFAMDLNFVLVDCDVISINEVSIK
jgi:hypothetical protein